MVGRSVKPWVGKTPDAAIPAAVKLRVFERAGGRCQSCTRKILTGDSWHADHIEELWDGGAHAETNLQCLCPWCHLAKTGQGASQRAEAKRQRAKHIGVKKQQSRRSSFQTNRGGRFKAKIGGGIEPR